MAIYKYVILCGHGDFTFSWALPQVDVLNKVVSSVIIYSNNPTTLDEPNTTVSIIRYLNDISKHYFYRLNSRALTFIPFSAGGV